MDSDDAEVIKKATDELAQAAHKLAEAMYAQAQQPGAADEPLQKAAGGHQEGGQRPRTRKSLTPTLRK
jgi:molecular chaperone DnaK